MIPLLLLTVPLLTLLTLLLFKRLNLLFLTAFAPLLQLAFALQTGVVYADTIAPEDFFFFNTYSMTALALVNVIFLFVGVHGCVKTYAQRHAVASDGGITLRFQLGFMLLLGALNLLCVCQHAILCCATIETAVFGCALMAYDPQRPQTRSAVLKMLLTSGIALAMALFGCFLLNAALPPGEALVYETVKTMPMNPTFFRVGILFIFAAWSVFAMIFPFQGAFTALQSSCSPLSCALLSGLFAPSIFIVIRHLDALAQLQGHGAMINTVFLIVGLLSLCAGAVRIYFQRELKRVFALCTTANAGWVLIAFALDVPTVAFVQLATFSLAMTALFLTLHNLETAAGHAHREQIKKALSRTPFDGVLLFGGCAALCAFAPFTLFAEHMQLLQTLAHEKAFIFLCLAAAAALFYTGAVFRQLLHLFSTAEPHVKKLSLPQHYWLTRLPALLLLLLLLMAIRFFFTLHAEVLSC